MCLNRCVAPREWRYENNLAHFFLVALAITGGRHVPAKSTYLQGQKNVGKSKAREIPQSLILKQSDSLSALRKLPLKKDAGEL